MDRGLMRPTPAQRLREYARSLLLPSDPADHPQGWPWANDIPLAPRNAHWLALFLLGLPVASYWIHLFLFAANAPVLDDYEVLLGSTNRFLGSAGLLGKLAVLWAQHNEHRLVVPRLVALVQYFLFGHVNFRHLTFLGNLAWTASFVLIVRGHRKKARLPLLFYVPLSFVWFSLVHRENTFWAMGSLQNYGAMFFCIGALWYLQAGKILATCLSCAAGVLTSMLCWPLFVLCIGFALARQGWKQAGYLAGTAVFLTVFYFHGYAPAAGHPIVSMAVLDFEATLAFGLAVMGGALRFAGYSITLGLFCLAAILYLLFLRRASAWSVAVALLSLLQAAAIAVGRGGYGGEHYAGAIVASRFTIVSLVAASAIYLLAMDSTQDPRRAVRSLLFAGMLAMTYWLAMTAKADIFADLSREYCERSNSMVSYLHGVRLPLVCNDSAEMCEPILVRSQELGVFDYSTAFGSRRKPALHLGPVGPSLKMTSQIEFYDGARIQGWALIPGHRSTQCEIHLVLAQSPEHSYWIPTLKTHRPEASVSQHVQFDYDMAGFEAFPELFDIPLNDYRVGIAIATGDGLALEWTDRSYRPAH
jgi:hypothetical protein